MRLCSFRASCMVTEESAQRAGPIVITGRQVSRKTRFRKIKSVKVSRNIKIGFSGLNFMVRASFVNLVFILSVIWKKNIVKNPDKL